MDLNDYSGGVGYVYVRGWAFDPDSPSAQLPIHVYVEDSDGEMYFAGSLTANQSRTDVDNVYHVGANHGFEGKVYTRGCNSAFKIHVAALDNERGGDAASWMDTTGVQITLDETKPTISEVTFDSSLIKKTSFRIIAKVTDNCIVDRVRFPAWKSNQGGDQATWWDAGQVNETTWFADITRSTDVQTYYGHVYAYDYQGNETSVGTFQHSNLVISFSANGGSCSTSNKEVTAAWFNDTAFQTYGSLPTPTRTGYSFEGWYTAASGGTKITSSSKVTTKSNHTLHAHWTDTQAPTISNTNLSSVTSASAVFSVTATDNVGVDHVNVKVWHGDYTANKPNAIVYPAAKSGNVWSATVPLELSDGESWYVYAEAYDSAGNRTDSKIGGLKQLLLSFDPAGGTSKESERTMIYLSMSDSNGRAYLAQYGNLPVPVKNGYTFVGWFNADGNLISSETTVTNKEDHTLTAHWTVNQYTVSFDANGGTVSPANKQVTFDSTYGELPTPVRNGYIFLNWYTETGERVDNNTKVASLEDHTLYARWVAVTNYTNGKAQIAKGGNGLLITCDQACAVIIDKDGTYTSVNPQFFADNTYCFDIGDAAEVNVALKGDIDLNGKVNATDLLHARMLLKEEPILHQSLAANVVDIDNNSILNEADIQLMRRATKKTFTLPWIIENTNQFTDLTNGNATIMPCADEALVQCTSACVVLVKNGDEYTQIPAQEYSESVYLFAVGENREVLVALKGDVNVSGTLNNRDIAAIMNNRNNNPYSSLEACLSDVDGNGIIDEADVRLVVRAYSGDRSLKWAEKNSNKITHYAYGKAVIMPCADEALVQCVSACAVLVKNGEEYTRIDAQEYSENIYLFSVGENVEVVIALKGDVDLNGILNGNDYVEIANPASLNSLQFTVADLNEDGVINAIDQSLIKRMMLGKADPAYYQLTWGKDSPVYAKNLTLPKALTSIESAAFKGIKAVNIVLPDKVESIADDAFESFVLLVGPRGGYAEEYARNHSLPYMYADEFSME